MNIPDTLHYTENHEWIKMESDIATVGITDFAQGELGDIVYIDIASVGQRLQQNEIFGSIEAVKTVSDLFMPISGEVLSVNDLLEGSPDKVNSDPYGEGWIAKIKIDDAEELKNLFSSKKYSKLISQ